MCGLRTREFVKYVEPGILVCLWKQEYTYGALLDQSGSAVLQLG